MRTRRKNTKTESVTWLSLCLTGFAQFDVCVLLIMWLRGDGLYCDTRPFSEEKCNSFYFLFLGSNKQPSVLLWRQEHMTGSKWWTTSLFFGLTNVLFYVCLANNAREHIMWRYGPLLMFVCHNNMSVLMFVVVCLLFYWLSYFFCPWFDIFEEVLPSELQIWFTFSFHLWCTMWSISYIFMHYVPLSDNFC